MQRLSKLFRRKKQQRLCVANNCRLKASWGIDFSNNILSNKGDDKTQLSLCNYHYMQVQELIAKFGIKSSINPTERRKNFIEFRPQLTGVLQSEEGEEDDIDNDG
jgi:hypothetical protein